MSDEAEPARKHYELKPRDFERLNSLPPPDAPQPPGTAKNLSADQPINVHDLCRDATPADMPLLHQSQPTSANDVHSILRENLDRANAAGLNDVPTKPRRKSKRTRDYFIALAWGNLVLLGCTVLMPIYGAAGLIIFNVGITWIVWVVMDDY